MFWFKRRKIRNRILISASSKRLFDAKNYIQKLIDKISQINGISDNEKIDLFYGLERVQTDLEIINQGLKEICPQ